MINTILFDLDGTILDTLMDLTNAVNHTLRKFGYKERTAKQVRSFLGNGAKQLILKSLDGDESQLDEVLSYYMPYYEANSECLTKPYEGIEELLKKLKHNYKLGVVSNKHQKAVEKIIEKYFPNIFDVVIGEQQGVPKKPAPDMLFNALKGLNANIENTIFIGDSEVDIQTGKNAGMDVIAVAWGFRDKDELIDHEPNYLIDEVNDILLLLEGIDK
ncbi:HAD family hydrolase [Acholeplasma hippikon]|uniref:Phosphoglycolate phosphatase n=2 Tax=Acholeplasma hippikon TaxID=264636 RepID=A0A449BIV4_9MOLU|nr:HAD family hydrolase [Acholeplasma hippikon]VEU82394.1 Phosphoglycolate phosphatase [Acholeplasma hippikon]